MDRFIVANITVQKDLAINLKSNMDRFIGYFSYHKNKN